MKKTMLIVFALVSSAVFADAISVTPAVPYASWTRPYWFSQFSQKKALAAKGGYPIVFLGDSITYAWASNGRSVWTNNYETGQYRALNAGISGDRTENVLWRLKNGQLDGLNPKAVVLMIGTNNIGHRRPEDECAYDVLCGIQAVVDDLLVRCKEAKIIVHPILPRGVTTNNPARVRADAVNMMLAEWINRLHREADRANRSKPGSVPQPRVLFCDFSAKIVGPDGVLSKQMAPDYLHPGRAGYEIWAKELKPYLDYALGLAEKPPRTHFTWSCPTAVPVKGPRATVAKCQSYWLTGLGGKNPRFLKKVNEIADRSDHYYDIVMLGDSITHFWENPGHKKHFDKTFAGYSVLNLGFGGHHTENVLWNITYGGFLDKIQTRLFTLLIGTNNTADSAEDTALGIKRILDALAVKQPTAKVILMPIFPRYQWPRGENPAAYLPGSPERVRNEKVNELIRPFADGKRVIWCDFNKQLLPAPDGIPSKEILADGVHPAAKGYDIWAAAMMPIVRKTLGR